MNEQSQEMFVQLLLRNIRQMYYSRAYCEPRLQRFMIRAQPPQPPSQPQATSQPKTSPEPQAPSRPATEDNTAADGLVVGVRKLFCDLSATLTLILYLFSTLRLFTLRNGEVYQMSLIEARLRLIFIDTTGCRRRNGQSWL